MGAESVVALVATAIIAISVPYVTFRLALRQDQLRWSRERRAEVYVDLLTEAYAEQQYLEYDMADDDTREHMRPHFTDLRLPPFERARLGARGTIFASRQVNALFNRMQHEALWSTLTPNRHEGHRMVARVNVGGLIDELQAAVRRELGADDVRLDPTTGRSGSDQAQPR